MTKFKLFDFSIQYFKSTLVLIDCTRLIATSVDCITQLEIQI